MNRPNKVLAVTKRTANLCATQAWLYSAGLELITATNLAAARALVRTLPVRGIIVCYHSWTESERESLLSELQEAKLPTMRCPGCAGCDETCGKAGIVNDVTPLSRLLSQLPVVR